MLRVDNSFIDKDRRKSEVSLQGELHSFVNNEVIVSNDNINGNDISFSVIKNDDKNTDNNNNNISNTNMSKHKHKHTQSRVSVKGISMKSE